MNTLNNPNFRINKNYIHPQPASNKLAKGSLLNRILENEKAEILKTSTSPCGLAEEILNDYVDGELEKITESRVEDHLRSCSCCKEAVNELYFLKASSTLLSKENNEISKGIKERLRSVLNKELGLNLKHEFTKTE